MSGTILVTAATHHRSHVVRVRISRIAIFLSDDTTTQGVLDSFSVDEKCI